MALLEIRIPNNEIIRVAQSQGYGIAADTRTAPEPLTIDGAEEFLLKKVKTFLMSRLKIAETREVVRLAKKQVEDALDAEDVVKIVRAAP